MTDKIISDAGAGRALFLTRVKLTLHAVSMAMWAGALPGFLLPLVLWISSLAPHDVDLLKARVMSHVVSTTTARKWDIRDEDGVRRVLTVVRDDGVPVQLLTPHQFRVVSANLSPRVAMFGRVLLVCCACAVVGYALVWWSLSRLGRKARENKRLDGGLDVVTPTELAKLVKKEGPGPYKILDIPLPKQAPMQGILFAGAPGTGKSLGQHDLMQQVFARRKKCVIYDPTGEYFKAYFRPEKDIFFNPAIKGTVPWSLFAELENTYDSNTLAEAFLPKKGGVVHGASAFFEDAARALFSVILLRLAQRGAQYTRIIAEAILDMPEDELELLIQKSVASSAVGGDSKGQRQGVISSISIYLDGIAAVPDGNWSLREFYERDDDTRFFIVGTDDTQAMFLPLFRLILTVAFGIIAAKQEVVHEDKYWFFLDEVAKLGDIKLDEVQAQLRKYGVCVAAAIQADKQFVTSMGPDRGATVMNCFGTAALLRAVEPDLAERIAKRLGRQEVAVVSKGQALAVTDWRDGGSLNQGEQERWVVMPTNITRMKDCTAYVRLPCDYPPAFVDYRNWLPKWYRPWARADRFKPKQDMPPRDDRFKVIRAQDQDALASVRAEAEAARQAAAKAAEEAKAAVEKTGVWVVKDLETGELVPAEASESAPSTAPKSSAQENQVVSAEASSAGGLFP